MGNCKDKVAALRARLLDLTGRNGLISFRHSAKSRRYIRFVDDVPSGLLQRLEGGKVLRIASLPEPDVEPRDEKAVAFLDPLEQAKATDEEYLREMAELEDATNPKAAKKIEWRLRDRVRLKLGLLPVSRGEAPDPSEVAQALGINPSYELSCHPQAESNKRRDELLQTLYFPEDLDRRLRLIYEQSRLTESETGVNTLHLAVGFLEWYDSKDSDKAILSPLLLFPVQVDRQIAKGNYIYKLEPRDEEAASNICLRERLKQDFGIIIPPIEPEEEFDSYVSRILEVVKKQPHWRVRRFATLGFFAFSKLVMHEDLGDPVWQPEEDSLVGKLLNGQETGGALFAEDYFPDLPEFQSKIPLLALDADSSQISALIDAMDGKNLVIEGPPGTGKSQTIANIIAAAMSQGKKVLFVAEKTAALEAVKRYLDRADLGSFCLELHSNKSRRTEVLKSISDTIKLRSAFTADSKVNPLLKRQGEIREEISRYLSAIHSKHGDLGHTCRDLIWRFSNILTEFPEVFEKIQGVSIPDVASISIDRFDEVQSAFTELAKVRLELFSQHKRISDHPWFGFAHDSLNPLTEKDLVRSVQELLRQVDRFLTDVDSIDLLKVAPQCRTIFALHDLFSRCGALSPPPQRAFTICLPLLQAGHQSLLDQFIQNKETIELAQSSLSHVFMNHESLKSVSHELLEKLASEIAVGALSIGITFNVLDTQRIQMKANLDILETISKIKAEFNRLGLDVKSARQMSDALRTLVEITAVSDSYFRFRNLPGLSLSTQKFLEATRSEIEHCHELERELGGTFRLDLGTDLITLKVAASAFSKTGFWKIFSSDYRQAKQLIKDISCISNEMPQSEVVSLLNLYVLFLEVQSTIKSSKELKNIAGIEYRDTETPVQGFLDCLRVKRILDSCATEPRTWRDLIAGWAAKISAQDISSLKLHNQNYGELENALREQFLEVTSIDDFLADTSRKISKAEIVLALAKDCHLKGDITLSEVSRIAGLVSKDRTSQKIISGIINESGALRLLQDGADIPTDDLRHCLDYVSRIQAVPFSDEARISLMSERGVSQLELIHSLGTAYVQTISNLREGIAKLEADLSKGNLKARFGVEDISKINLDQLRHAVAEALTDTSLLAPFYSYLRADSELRNPDTIGLLSKWEENEHAFSDLALAHQSLVISELLKNALMKFPDLSRKFGTHLDELRNEFKKNDKALLIEYCKKLRKQLLEVAIPAGISRGKPRDLTELGLLEHEISKKTKHVPIRDLMRRAISAVKAVKPCFMMSPLSVAQFLPPRIPKFDLIVMDEASQLRTEDVIGSLLRGAQTIIVGDPHQLPPSSFFDFSLDGAVEDEEAADLGLDHESVLDMAIKSYRPARRLKWHYRSRHQSLIAYSNQEFYDRELVIFPSPFDHHPDLGMEFVPCGGVYEKRRNQIEAEKIVQAAARHMALHYDRSLGIVTMNQEQKELIRDLLDSRLKVDPVMQDFIAKWEDSPQRERFFVKNLENVQGDERDVIIVSTVYGRDSVGNFYQRFGPINGPFGHRRLNVLFTRAKCKVSVFTSMDPEWIVVENKSSRGLKVFRGFLEYAKTGRLAAAAIVGDKGTDSPFEDFVLKALKGRGFEVVTQVGVAGYFIDLAVRDPKSPGRFVLGIECDGKTYHSGRSARDRDRLRQENLERLGWNIYRIWSTDWFANPKVETEKLIRAIELKLSDAPQTAAGFGNVNFVDGQLIPQSAKMAQEPAEDHVPEKSESINSDASVQSGSAEVKLTEHICRNLVIWNKKLKRMTNTYDVGLLGKLESVAYFLSRGRTVDKIILEDAKKALTRAVSLGFDPSSGYEE